MGSAAKETLYDRLLRGLRNNPIIVVGLIVFTVLRAVSALIEALNSP
jgi:hypothetical protein